MKELTGTWAGEIWSIELAWISKRHLTRFERLLEKLSCRERRGKVFALIKKKKKVKTRKQQRVINGCFS